ncbi:unnamed protein product [Bursaphelenchus xylophilus]|uniref:(pine wood nematode) hypothetical protein n=1 Tax=Bursaphelenchus xylophilus TaxID=6326 RepID=A0A1I7SAJ1_BURXY|nr:unnamed protein product [Bursaphelenchus xylophilus]CAG9079345.1 unnamed protein product [Bursaphelenchus xylophilus]
MGACTSSFQNARAKLASLNGFNDSKKPAKEDPATAEKIKERKAKKGVEKIALTEEVVQEYIELEKQIYRFEYKNVLKKYESKTIFADEVKKTVDQLEATYKELKKQTEKERADVENIEQPSVKSFLKQQGTWDERVEKEKKEYMDALNKQEVAEKELRGARAQYERAAKIADIYKGQVDQLNELYEKQDRMLIGIFGPNYASDKENTLEAELDDAMEWQQRVSLAKFKWTNGRVLLVHASTQMAFGITRWKELEDIETGNTRMRYFAAAEARNNFIAASQNVQSCRVYLGRVRFPYATEEEMNLMEQTIHTSFSDIQSNASLKRALTVYQNTHKKVAALIQWFDKVINDTIIKDLEKANTNVAKKQKQLREERLTLMKKKYKEEFNKDLKIDYDKNIHDETDEELLALEAEQVKDQQELPGEDLKEILTLSQPEGKHPTPLPLTKLAPIPSKDALFGDVKKKIDELDHTRNSIQQRNNAMKEKSELALQEKLRLRQQQGRRTRPQRAKSVIVPLPSLSEQADAAAENGEGHELRPAKKKRSKSKTPSPVPPA